MATDSAAKRPSHWSKKVLAALGVLAVLIFLVATLLVVFMQPKREKIGGAWVLVSEQSLAIEAGPHHSRLERHHLFNPVVVANDPAPAYFIGDDCMIFAVHETKDLKVTSIKAACGDQPPIFLGYADTLQLDWRDLHDPAKINGKEMTWAEIRGLARQGKSNPRNDR